MWLYYSLVAVLLDWTARGDYTVCVLLLLHCDDDTRLGVRTRTGLLNGTHVAPSQQQLQQLQVIESLIYRIVVVVPQGRTESLHSLLYCTRVAYSMDVCGLLRS